MNRISLLSCLGELGTVLRSSVLNDADARAVALMAVDDLMRKAERKPSGPVPIGDVRERWSAK